MLGNQARRAADVVATFQNLRFEFLTDQSLVTRRGILESWLSWRSFTFGLEAVQGYEAPCRQSRRSIRPVLRALLSSLKAGQCPNCGGQSIYKIDVTYKTTPVGYREFRLDCMECHWTTKEQKSVEELANLGDISKCPRCGDSGVVKQQLPAGYPHGKVRFYCSIEPCGWMEIR